MSLSVEGFEAKLREMGLGLHLKIVETIKGEIVRWGTNYLNTSNEVVVHNGDLTTTGYFDQGLAKTGVVNGGSYVIILRKYADNKAGEVGPIIVTHSAPFEGILDALDFWRERGIVAIKDAKAEGV
jgi:hypothetical protein